MAVGDQKCLSRAGGCGVHDAVRRLGWEEDAMAAHWSKHGGPCFVLLSIVGSLTPSKQIYLRSNMSAGPLKDLAPQERLGEGASSFPLLVCCTAGYREQRHQATTPKVTQPGTTPKDLNSKSEL